MAATIVNVAIIVYIIFVLRSLSGLLSQSW